MLVHMWKGALVAALLAFALPRASAQDELARSAEPAGYREAITQAIQEYDAASYAEAREQFRRAHVLFPNARTLRGLGVTEYELHNYPEAVQYLEQALESRVRPLGEATRAQTEAVLERARGYVGKIVLEIEPSSARVMVDGEPIDGPADQPVLVSVGDHTIDVSATGYLAERRVLKIAGRETQRVRITLTVLTGESDSDGMATSSERPTPQPVYKKWWLWTGLAVVVGGGVAAALLLTREPDRREVASFTGNSPANAGPLYP